MLKFDLKFYILVYIKILESLDMFVGGFEAGRIEQKKYQCQAKTR